MRQSKETQILKVYFLLKSQVLTDFYRLLMLKTYHFLFSFSVQYTYIGSLLLEPWIKKYQRYIYNHWLIFLLHFRLSIGSWVGWNCQEIMSIYKVRNKVCIPITFNNSLKASFYNPNTPNTNCKRTYNSYWKTFYWCKKSIIYNFFVQI
jgi:hypothetical protein